jgi:leader peptidase (prepilin peptidase)/N-methyltransferase
MIYAVVLGVALYIGPELQVTWEIFPLAIVLLTLTWIDVDRFKLPDVLTLPLIGAGLLSALFDGRVYSALLGASIGYALIVICAWAYRHYRNREGIGLGDAKLLAAGGAWCGVYAIPVILMVASASALFVVVVIGRKRFSPEKGIAFGPFLALGIWAAFLHPIATYM